MRTECALCGRTRHSTTNPCTCIPARVWDDPDISAAVHHRDAQTVVRLLHTRADLSQSALARLCGVSHTTIQRALADRGGLTNPRRSAEALRLLGAPASPPCPAAPPAPPPSADPRQRQEAPVRRRRFLAAGSTATLAMLGLPPAEEDRLTTGDLDLVREHATTIARLDHTHGGAHVRATVTAHLRWAIGLLDRPAGPLRPQVFAAVGHLVNTAAFSAFDAYAHTRAIALWDLARELAEEADDVHLHAKICSNAARQQIWCADPATGLAHTDRALTRADVLSAPELAMLHTARARAHAKLGDINQTMAAIDAADSAFSRPTPDRAIPEWMGYYGHAQHHGDTGHALWDLAVLHHHAPATQPATERLNTAVCGHSDTYRRSRAISGTKLASLLMRSDREHGADVAMWALRDAGTVSSRRTQDDLMELAATAHHQGDSQLGALVEIVATDKAAA